MRKKAEQVVPRLRRMSWLLLGACCVALVAVPLAIAQTGAEYDLSWWTVDGGGVTLSTGEGYRLSGTAGQPDAGLLVGSGYTLGGGFWRGGAVTLPRYPVYLPLVVR
jgi:hypothetical protein